MISLTVQVGEVPWRAGWDSNPRLPDQKCGILH